MTYDIEKLIQDERAEIEDAIKDAIKSRDILNAHIKELRAKLDAAPRLHVRRQRKAKTEDDRGAEIKVRKAGQ